MPPIGKAETAAGLPTAPIVPVCRAKTEVQTHIPQKLPSHLAPQNCESITEHGVLIKKPGTEFHTALQI